ncbi:hypothetical protein ACPZ19_42955 [Amycolatopsis lurida]
MGSALRPGDQLASTVCTTRVVVVRAPAGGTQEVCCGGSPMVPAASAAARAPAGGGEAGAATLLGKRYADADGTLELLCVSSGSGELTCGGVPMTVKAVTPLPASD